MLEFTITWCIIIALLTSSLIVGEYVGRMPSTLKEEGTFNAEIIRTYEFDGIILGTSMCENFKCSEFDKLYNGYSYKLTKAGGHISDLIFIGKCAIKKHSIKAILMDLSYYNFIDSEVRQPINRTLYGRRTWLDKTRQHLSIGALREKARFILSFQRNQESDRDTLYCWSEHYPVGKMQLAKYLFERKKKDTGEKIQEDRLKQDYQKNLDELLFFIKSHNEITFYFFLPPFSVLKYHTAYTDNLFFRRMVFDMFLELSNVQLYDFQACRNICTNWSIYRDTEHYGEHVNSWILTQMEGENNRVNTKNRIVYEREYERLVYDFDYDIAIKELHEYYERNR